MAPVVLLIFLWSSIQLNAPTDFVYYGKVWRHRGGTPENSIQGVQESLRRGFKGIEIDLYFHNNLFYLSHDGLEQIKEGQTLSSLLDNIEDKRFNLWLDYKNLNLRNASSSLGLLNKLLKKHDLLNSTLVETKNISSSLITLNTGIHSLVWLTPSQSSLKMMIKSIGYKILIKYFGQRKISYEYKSSFADYCDECDHFIFTINHLKTLQSFKSYKVVLTDNDELL